MGVHEILSVQRNVAAPIERSMRTFVPVQCWLIADRFDVQRCPSPEGGLSWPYFGDAQLPELFPKSASNPQPAYCCPVAWANFDGDDVYLQDKMPAYLTTKAKQGRFRPRLPAHDEGQYPPKPGTHRAATA